MTSNKILVVDDDTAMLDLLAIMLERKGYSVSKTSDPPAALDRLITIQPNLMITDLMMPGLNGIELCQQVRSLPEYTTLPILMLSARTDELTIQTCLDAGASAYASKPIGSIDLVTTVQRLLSSTNASNSGG
jgi:DNA-binding response OmpR family regulator